MSRLTSLFLYSNSLPRTSPFDDGRDLQRVPLDDHLRCLRKNNGFSRLHEQCVPSYPNVNPAGALPCLSSL